LMLSRDDPEPMRSLSQEGAGNEQRGMPEDDSGIPLVRRDQCAIAHGARCALSHTVRVDDVDPHRLATREGAHHGTEGTGGAARAGDDPNPLIGMAPDLSGT